MAELQNLKSRIDQVDHNLKAAHSARAREGEALTALWQQIRTRFSEQEQELTRLRRRTAELEDTKDELLAMVGHLLRSIEDATSDFNDGTIPEISRMAGELLGEPSSAATHAHEPARQSGAPERLSAPRMAEHQGPGPASPPGESLSPGIRTLIARIEGVFEEDEDFEGGADEEEDAHDTQSEEPFVGSAEPEPVQQEPSGDDLSRDLQEIEKLRDELQGLRRRISASGD